MFKKNFDAIKHSLQPNSRIRRWAYLPILLVITLVGSMLQPGISAAQSQNEVLTTVIYDGTQYDVDPLDDGSGNGVHTPGLDGGAQNNVVKTHDQIAVRVDWNVNEDATTGVFLTVTIPTFATFSPDPTGMFSGCDVALSSFPDPQTLLCSLGDQIEGSNGTIRVVATLSESFDGTEFDIPATLTTDDDSTGVTDGLDNPLVVSEAPVANWKKYEPEVSERVTTSTGEEGYVMMYPIALADFSQGANPIIGAGQISNASPIDLFDHAYGLVASAAVATPAQMTAAGFGTRASCGSYDGSGAFPITSGTWTCGTPTSPNGYPVMPISIAGFTTTPAPATNADGSPNIAVGGGVNVLSGQIAFWMPADEVDAEIDSSDNVSVGAAQFQNAIATQDASVPIFDQADILPIQIPGTNGFVDETATASPEGDDPADNVVLANFGNAPVGGSSPGATIGHNVVFLPGPLQILETNRYGDSETAPRHNIDLRTLGQGGLYQLPGSNAGIHAKTSSGDLIGDTPRGATLTIQSQVLTNSSVTTTLYDAPIQGCTAFDTTHYNLSAFDAIPVTVTDGVNATTPAVTGGYSTTANTGPLAHVYTGNARSLYNAWRGQYNAVGGDQAGLPYVVEFTDAPLQTVGTSFGVNNDELTCNDDDDGDAGWVDATDTAGLAVFDTANPGDGIYEGITRARVRITDHFAWARTIDTSENGYTGFQAFFQATVKTDLSVQTVNQELFALQSHSFGDLGANGVPDLVPYVGAAASHCSPYSTTNWAQTGNDIDSTTGYCNNTFIDDGVNSLDTADLVDWDDNSHTRSTTNSVSGITSRLNASGTVIHIVEAALGLSKSNNDGLGDIKNNGDLVQFTLSPSVIGSDQEALTNVKLSDNLPANYHFVQFLTQPTTPGSYCTAPSTPDGTITCQFSEPNPAVDTGALPPGLPGGWSDEVQIEVVVVGGIADPDAAVSITNSATLSSSGLGPWDPSGDGEFVGDVQAASKSKSNSANSFLPLPADEGAIIKAVDGLEGPCVLHPEVDPPDAAWATRCSMIDHDGDMSFILSLQNEGNTAFSDIEIVDVFPWNGDAVEPASNTSNQGSSNPNTLGDGRDPASDFAGTLGFVSMTPVSNATGAVTWVSGDPSGTISRDPDVTVGAAVNTWCDTVGGTVQVGTGTCPATANDVTATYTLIPGDLKPAETLELRLTLDSEATECDDIWTNTFGARVDEILLPIRSNDVSIMVNCEFDLALEKTIDPAFAPGADWITEGVTTIDFLMEVTNQEDPIEDFEVTDYIDTSVFTFAPSNLPGGTTTGSHTHPFTWDASNPAAPVVSVDGQLLTGESVFIPVTLIIEDSTGPLNNLAEISYFDTDGDPSNGDSNPDNPNNPSTGALTDEDSTPDDDPDNDPQPAGPGEPGDGEIDGDGSGDDPIDGDEDDQDIAGIPVYDLELIKTNTDVDFSVFPPTATFNLTVTNQGNADVFLVDLIDYGAPGLTYDPTATAAAWTTAGLTGVTDAAPTFTIDTIAVGETVTVPVVYQMTDLTLAPFTNAAEISAFDSDDDPDNAADPFAVDADSTPDSDPDDDDVIDHNNVNNDPDEDGNLNEATDGDEDDHDIETIAPYDLALNKTMGMVNSPLSPNGSITMLLTVENQAAPVSTIDIVDYIDPTMWLPFDPALNPDGSVDAASTAAADFSFTWDYSDPLNPVALVTPDAGGALVYGENVVIPITLQPVADFASVAPLSNFAEISNFDNDEDPDNGDASDGTISDMDSNPDDENGSGPGEDPDGDMVDDDLDGDGEPGSDEDDHDGLFFPIYDLELVKANPVVDYTQAPPTVTYDLTVTNQGTEDVFLVDITEYGAPGLAYNATATAALLPTGVTDANPTFTIDTIPAGSNVVISVVYDIVSLADAPYTNAAEISAFDSDDDPDNEPDPFAVDIDSTPDDSNDDDVIDHNNVNSDPDGDGNLNEATDGDEDDHDIETIDPFTTDAPAIGIEKDTNGVQSDEAPGEIFALGDPVTWTYVVTNTGGTALADATVTDSQGVTVSCDIDGDGTFDGTNVIPFLAHGASVTCEGTGEARPGPYENIADVTGDPIVPDWLTCGCDPADPATWPTDASGYIPLVDADGNLVGPVVADDPSHYIGITPGEPAIDIEKSTNGVQSDEAPGENLPATGAVTWTYVVTNAGGTALANATVTDSQGVTVSCDIDGDGTFDGTNVIAFLAVGESVTCEGTGEAVQGPYENVANVTGDPLLPNFDTCDCDPEDPATWPTDPTDFIEAIGEDGLPLGPVTDADASHYTGVVFDLALEKALADGQSDEVAVGDDVTFTITVINQGAYDAANVSIVDYLPAAMVLNDSDWTDNGDGTASISIAETIPAGESFSVDITVTLVAAGDIDNQAEIAQATALDEFGNPILDANGNALADVDSIADLENSDNLSDDESDEDDHDAASIKVNGSGIAFTGQGTGSLLAISVSLMLLGLFAVRTTRRRRINPVA